VCPVGTMWIESRFASLRVVKLRVPEVMVAREGVIGAYDAWMRGLESAISYASGRI
jgi:hypothetical protein